MDLHLTEDGDMAISPSGDLALTKTNWRDDVQQAYLRMMTDVGDYVLYPALGATLSTLYGMPQSPETAKVGISLIQAAMEREGRFTGKPVDVQAVPTGQQTIRFDVYISAGSQDRVRLSVEQDLGVV